MDDKGNIKEFGSHSEAIAAGYKHQLTADEAEHLSTLQSEDRLPELIFFEYHKTVLKGRKTDTLEKARLRSAFRFAVTFIQGGNKT